MKDASIKYDKNHNSPKSKKILYWINSQFNKLPNFSINL